MYIYNIIRMYTIVFINILLLYSIILSIFIMISTKLRFILYL